MRISTQLEDICLVSRSRVVLTLDLRRIASAKAKKTGTAGFSQSAAIHSALHVLAPERVETVSLQGEALASRAQRSAPSMIQTQFVHHGV
jgi:hypothetical protein